VLGDEPLDVVRRRPDGHGDELGEPDADVGGVLVGELQRRADEPVLLGLDEPLAVGLLDDVRDLLDGERAVVDTTRSPAAEHTSITAMQGPTTRHWHPPTP